ncbi:MAG: ABC transporter permease [Candidatus Methylomirabilales bacterium]
MDYLVEGLLQAGVLIFTFNPEVYQITFLTIQVSLGATLLASAAGIPLAVLLVEGNFRGKESVITLINTLMALPTVVVGLSVFAFFARQGPLGGLELLFTPTAIVMGEFILATPIIIALTIAALKGADPRIRETALTLGASRSGAALMVVLETRYAVVAAVLAGFARVVAEVGSALIVGGNIRGYTRTLATAIALETGKGEFAFAIALGLILILLALVTNIGLRLLVRRR